MQARHSLLTLGLGAAHLSLHACKHGSHRFCRRERTTTAGEMIRVAAWSTLDECPQHPSPPRTHGLHYVAQQAFRDDYCSAPQVVQIWPNLVEFGTSLVEFQPMLDGSGPKLAEIETSLAEFVNFGRFRAKSGRTG